MAGYLLWKKRTIFCELNHLMIRLYSSNKSIIRIFHVTGIHTALPCSPCFAYPQRLKPLLLEEPALFGRIPLAVLQLVLFVQPCIESEGSMKLPMMLWILLLFLMKRTDRPKQSWIRSALPCQPQDIGPDQTSAMQSLLLGITKQWKKVRNLEAAMIKN